MNPLTCREAAERIDLYAADACDPSEEEALSAHLESCAACAAALEMGVCDYRFVRRYLERNPQLPLSLRQIDPLIRQLTLYRDFIENKTKESEL